MNKKSPMASIAITQDNLSHFNKRLQKALKASLGIDVKLTQAADIFAQACGKSSTYEIQKILQAEVPMNAIETTHSMVNSATVYSKFSGVEKEKIINMFEHIFNFKVVGNTQIPKIVVHKVASQLFFEFVIRAKNDRWLTLKFQFVRYENFSEVLEEQLSDTVLDDSVSVSVNTRLLFLFNSIWPVLEHKTYSDDEYKEIENYDNFVIDTIGNHLFKNVSINSLGVTSLVLYESEDFKNRKLLNNNQGFFKPVFLISLTDISQDAYADIKMFTDLKDALSFISESSKEYLLESVSLSTKFVSCTDGVKDISYHYVFHKKEDDLFDNFFAKKDGEVIDLREFRKTYHKLVNSVFNSI